MRFHLYWAGSDPDGVVNGFYWAVTETTATPEPGATAPPPVPGPKPQDYHYTPRTDTTFIFQVSENAPDRQHAFFIYSVDNRGRPDPTPARFLFTAIDRFPPMPIIPMSRDVLGHLTRQGGARAAGLVFNNFGGIVQAVTDTVWFDDSSDPTRPARDTAAVNSRLDFHWTARLGIAGNDVKYFCYKLEEPEFICGDATTTSASYNTGLPGSSKLSPGLKVFRVRAVDQAGGAADSSRRIYLNYAPDTWFWGPNLGDPLFTPGPDQNGERHYLSLTGVNPATWPGIPGTGMSADSFKTMPVNRPERRTFFEIYNGRLYARSEGDTIHMNSWAVFFSGGYDKDSPYRVKVDPIDPDLPADTASNPVILPRPENGSPIGFRSQLSLRTDPFGSPTSFTASGLYPIFDPASVFRLPSIGTYWPMILSGRAFLVTRAQDGDDLVDPTVAGDPRDLVDHVEGGTATPSEVTYRRKVMTFYVNRSPFLNTCDNGFTPKDPNGPCPGTTTFTGPVWALYLPSDDVDPFDPNQANRPTGVPTVGKVLRYSVKIHGKSLATLNDTTYLYHPGGPSDPFYFNTFNPSITVPDDLAGGPVTVEVQLCDCIQCEQQPGQGRCVTYLFPANYVHALSSDAASSSDRGRSR